MSDETTPAVPATKATPKKPSVKKTPAAKAATAKRTTSAKTATSAPKRKPATKKSATEIVAVPAAATATAAASGAFSTVTQKVSAMIPEGMGEKAMGLAGEAKDKASDAVANLGKLINDSAAAIDDNVGPEYGDYARSAAQSVTDAAERLRAKPVDEIAQDTREFVRAKPGTALGIAAVASLVLAKVFGAIFGRRR